MDYFWLCLVMLQRFGEVHGTLSKRLFGCYCEYANAASVVFECFFVFTCYMFCFYRLGVTVTFVLVVLVFFL